MTDKKQWGGEREGAGRNPDKVCYWRGEKVVTEIVHEGDFPMPEREAVVIIEGKGEDTKLILKYPSGEKFIVRKAYQGVCDG